MGRRVVVGRRSSRSQDTAGVLYLIWGNSIGGLLGGDPTESGHGKHPYIQYTPNYKAL